MEKISVDKVSKVWYNRLIEKGCGMDKQTKIEILNEINEDFILFHRKVHRTLKEVEATPEMISAFYDLNTAKQNMKTAVAEYTKD